MVWLSLAVSLPSVHLDQNLESVLYHSSWCLFKEQPMCDMPVLFPFGLISIYILAITCAASFVTSSVTFDIVLCNQASSSQWSRRLWWNLMVRRTLECLLDLLMIMTFFFWTYALFFPNLMSCDFNFQLHLSRNMHQCGMSGPSRTDTSALVCGNEIASNDHPV